MLFWLLSPAHAVPVCSTCAYHEIRQALEVGETTLELTDSRQYQGFTLEDDQLGPVTITTSVAAYIRGDNAPSVEVSGGADLTLAVPVRGVETDSMIRVEGPATLLHLPDADLDCEARVGVAQGGAVDIRSGATLEVDGGLIRRCSADEGGALFVDVGSTLVMSGSVTLSESEATYNGGGIYADRATVQLTDVMVEGCTSSQGGGLYAYDAAVVLEGATTFDDNTADIGAGMKLALGTLDVPPGPGVWFTNNRTLAGPGLGAGAALDQVSAGELHDLHFELNVAIRGGGLWINGSTLKLTSPTFLENGAIDDGGGLDAVDSALTLDDAVFTGNAAGRDGGHIHLFDTSLVASGLTATLGEADLGGALAMQADSATPTLDLTAAVLMSNDAKQNGGAVWLQGTALNAIVTGGQATDNTATLYGGVLAAESIGDLQIDGVAWSDNAAIEGGALYLLAVSSASITESVFDGNTAYDFGGSVEAIATNDLRVTDNTFLGGAATIAGGAVDLFATNRVSLTRNLYCGTSGGQFGGAISFFGGCYGSCTVSNERLFGASATEGSALYSLGAAVDARHLAVRAPGGAGSVLGADEVAGHIDLVASYIEGAGDEVFRERSGGSISLDRVNVDPPPPGPARPGLTTDPTFLLGSADLQALPCGVEFRLHPTSALTASDIGAWGGPDADPDDLTTDDDGDGVPWVHDCEDLGSPDVGGTLPERCDNGIDDDCDGQVDEPGGVPSAPWWPDPDGDGYADPNSAPGKDCTLPEGAITDPERLLDCGEGDATRFPGAQEIADDGIDQDCDGADARSFVAGGSCGCAQGAPSPAALGVLVALGVSRRRTGSSRSPARPRHPTRPD